MRYIKQFEKNNREDIFKSAVCYLEEDQPISKGDGFFECCYDFFKYNYFKNDFDDESKVIVTYYFKYDSHKELDLFYVYLKKNRLRIISEDTGYHIVDRVFTNVFTKQINILLSYNRAKKFAELYDTITKYNL
jgi:hypothetical protein